jgi:hypothetical protein
MNGLRLRSYRHFTIHDDPAKSTSNKTEFNLKYGRLNLEFVVLQNALYFVFILSYVKGL